MIGWNVKYKHFEEWRYIGLNEGNDVIDINIDFEDREIRRIFAEISSRW